MGGGISLKFEKRDFLYDNGIVILKDINIGTIEALNHRFSSGTSLLLVSSR